MGVLKSKLFGGDQPVFENCATSHAGNIRPMVSRGPHVGKIQQALFILDNAEIDSDELAQEFYGSSTAAAVRKYKANHKPPIIGSYQSSADDIVGMQTIRWLDKEYGEFEKKNPAPIPPPNPSPLIKKKFDIVVRILGQDPRSPLAGKTTGDGAAQINVPDAVAFSRKINTDKYLQTHMPVSHISFYGGGGRAKASTDPTDDIFKMIEHMTEFEIAQPDKVIILGYSIGGRNAATLARKLNTKKIAIDYLGIIDAAFDDDRDAERTAALTCKAGDNIFQTASNDLRTEFPEFEFHGAIPGIPSNNLGDTDTFYKEKRDAFFGGSHLRRRRAAEEFFNAVHEKAVKDGYAQAQRRTLEILGS